MNFSEEKKTKNDVVDMFADTEDMFSENYNVSYHHQLSSSH